MKTRRYLGIVISGLLATSAWAQDGTAPLNLKLPPSSVPSAAASAAKPAGASTTPGVYYGDTSGTTDASLAANRADDTADTCDDATYNNAQMHGSVGMGVVGGNHVSGNYQTAAVNISKAFGSCDHPQGGVSISIGGGQGHFNHDRDRYGR